MNPEEEAFEQFMVETAVQTLTPREREILSLMDSGKNLVREGRVAFIGFSSTSPRAVNSLLRVCAIRLEEGSKISGYERYALNRTGRRILSATHNNQ